MSRFFNIQTDAEGVCTIFLYGDIGDYYEVQSGRVARELLEAEKAGSRIHVRINSNGGDVYCGIAIYNAIKNSKADVHIYVDGIAASMASVIALCGKPVEMSKYARLMLHSVSGGCYGNKKEMQKCIEEIESLEDSLGDIYAARLGMTKEEVKATFFDGEDHWLTADDALRLGFIDGIYDAEPVPGGQYPGTDIYFIQQPAHGATKQKQDELGGNSETPLVCQLQERGGSNRAGSGLRKGSGPCRRSGK